MLGMSSNEPLSVIVLGSPPLELPLYLGFRIHHILLTWKTTRTT